MNRYSVIVDKNPREIILLRSHPCKWGRCFFCDYINDNSVNEEEMISTNKEIIKKIDGRFNSLEVINSASVFELPKQSLIDIREKCIEKGITTLYFEAYYNYRYKLGEIRDFFQGINIEFKCGIESFDHEFRNSYLNKNIIFETPQEVAQFFDNICLLVGIEGQNEKMIDRDMEIAQKYFKKACINIFVENTTPVKRDEKLVKYFKDNYSHLENMPNIEILWNNTDFGVGN
ncbi:radical SAM protein [Peptostreptococcus equinus]|uniref:Radical SAM protein n=1 Tax=Peptostreptococcus equinus TaxID=3003601 RepID=A0ABY7JR40_9FIRM|nr:radical SAM protein [Peptostreptococcus sp. CBA3647]WAW14954.1 radical SAM protein [Peptostreptococcus sp. CBA3647]